MADASDVEIAIAALVGAILYPAGASGEGGYDVAGGYGVGAAYGDIAPPASGGSTPLQPSVTGVPARVYRGDPTKQQLDPDNLAGIAHVTVMAKPGMDRLGKGNLDPAIQLPAPASTFAITNGASPLQLTGTPAQGQLVGIAFGGQSWVYTASASDTPISIAIGLATMIQGQPWLDDSGNFVTDDNGNVVYLGPSASAALGVGCAVLTIGTTENIVARTTVPAAYMIRPRQQEQLFAVSFWAPSPAARDALCKVVDAELAALDWLQLPDQAARIVWHASKSNDMGSKSALWFREIIYRVCYWTTLTRSAPTMLFGGPTVNTETLIA